MSTQGTVEIDFGSFPGNVSAKTTITGQGGIASNSFVEAWVFPSSTGSTDHSVDEHIVDMFDVVACNIVAGTGFDIFAIVRPGTGTRYGKYRLGWVWA